jgi:predicted PurR-regulated permease PerM
MEEEYIKKVMSSGILISLGIVCFFMLKPILMSIFFGIFLAYLFLPLYAFLNKKINSPNVSAIIICLTFTISSLLLFWMVLPSLIEQSFEMFLASQQLDFVAVLKNILPSYFNSYPFLNEFGSIANSFVIKTLNSMKTFFSDLVIDFPTILLKFFVVLFTFFFVLKESHLLFEYIKSFLPFPKDIQKKLIEYSQEITASVIYGQIVNGFLQGVFVWVGLLIFNIPNTMLLALAAIIAGVLPISNPLTSLLISTVTLLIEESAALTLP